MSPETATNLKNATTMLTTLEPAAKKAHKEFGDYRAKLEQAMKKDDADLIETYRPQLEKIVTRMESLEGTATGALVAVKQLRQDEEFMAAKHTAVEALAERISTSQDLLTQDVEAAQDLFKEADKKLNALEGGHKAAVQDFALLDGDVKAIAKLAETAAKQSAGLDKAARTAFAAGNQPGLTSARVALIKLNEPAPRVGVLKGRVQKFMKTYAGDEFGKKGQDLLDDLERAAGDFQAADDLVKPLLDLGQVPAAPKINLPKAIKVLKLESSDGNALGKILSGPPASYEKQLDAWAKTKKLAMSGKAIVATLKKEQAIA